MSLHRMVDYYENGVRYEQDHLKAVPGDGHTKDKRCVSESQHGTPDDGNGAGEDSDFF